jgi:hemolysin III
MKQTGEPTAQPRVKPRYRGVSHEATFYLGVVGAVVLVSAASPGLATLAAAIYALSFVMLFGASALYHRPNWSPQRRLLFQRIDHSMIFVLIAGTYTPILLLAVEPEIGTPLLWAVWLGAAVGVSKSVFWPQAPKVIMPALAVLLGWVVVAEWTAVLNGIGDRGADLILSGGAAYTVGAVVYTLKWPDPRPRTFGYHEIFHLLVIVGALCHATLVAQLAVPMTAAAT